MAADFVVEEMQNEMVVTRYECYHEIYLKKLWKIPNLFVLLYE